MKKLLSILLGFIVLLSGMNLSIATHFCDGEIAATRVSFSGKKATCGMRSDAAVIPASGTSMARHCCDDKMAVYAVDKNYSPSYKLDNKIVQNVFHHFFLPGILVLHCYSYSFLDRTNISPPDNYTVSAVHLADICVFRI
jgi:hypothetical protein